MATISTVIQYQLKSPHLEAPPYSTFYQFYSAMDKKDKSKTKTVFFNNREDLQKKLKKSLPKQEKKQPPIYRPFPPGVTVREALPSLRDPWTGRNPPSPSLPATSNAPSIAKRSTN